MSRDNFAKWFYFGLHIKRWLLLLLVGVAIMGLGFAYLLRELYATYTFPDEAYYATLQFIPRWLRGVIFISVASGITLFGAWRLNRSIAEAVMPENGRQGVVDRIYQRRTQRRGPRVVVIGGGTGMSRLLRGMKAYTSNLTAIVTVADDGGSSGVLRRDMNVLPPGDIRNCIAALADAEPLVTELFQYRFGDDAGEGIAGHSFGNLYLVAMSEVTGSMERAIAETSRVLAVRGEIVPSTLADITLHARFGDGALVEGESAIPDLGRPPERVWIEPGDAPAHPRAMAALRDAELIVMGPGSLYTSVLPNLLVPGIAAALFESSAHRVFVANVATQHGETDGYSAADHYAAVRRHMDRDDVAHIVLANSNLPGETFPEQWQSTPVRAPGDADYGSARLVLADVVDHDVRQRHDEERLASTLMRLYFERDLRVIDERVEAARARV